MDELFLAFEEVVVDVFGNDIICAIQYFENTFWNDFFGNAVE